MHILYPQYHSVPGHKHFSHKQTKQMLITYADAFIKIAGDHDWSPVFNWLNPMFHRNQWSVKYSITYCFFRHYLHTSLHKHLLKKKISGAKISARAQIDNLLYDWSTNDYQNVIHKYIAITTTELFDNYITSFEGGTLYCPGAKTSSRVFSILKMYPQENTLNSSTALSQHYSPALYVCHPRNIVYFNFVPATVSSLHNKE